MAQPWADWWVAETEKFSSASRILPCKGGSHCYIKRFTAVKAAWLA